MTEITAVTLVVAGIVAWRSSRFLLVGLVFSAAVLSRETAMLVVAALLVTRIVDGVRRRGGPGRQDVAWAAPLLAFAGWQAMCLAVNEAAPHLEEQNAGKPLTGAAHAVIGWIEHPRLTNVLELVQLAILVATVVLAFLHLRDSRSSPFERVAFVFAVLLLLALSSQIWNNDPRHSGRWRTCSVRLRRAPGCEVLPSARAHHAHLGRLVPGRGGQRQVHLRGTGVPSGPAPADSGPTRAPHGRSRRRC